MKNLLFSAFALSMSLHVMAQSQDCSELFISEYVEGTGNDKALELYNPTNAPINLTGYTLERNSNGSPVLNSGGTLDLSGTIPAKGVWVVANGQTTTTPTSPACSPALQALADQLDGIYVPNIGAPMYMNGNDAIILKKNGNIIDIFGKTGDIAMNSARFWTDETGKNWTEDHTLIRKASIKKGLTVNPVTFNPKTEWDSLPKNTWTELKKHTCDCATTSINESNETILAASIYPNPSQGSFLIVATGAIVKAEVYTLAGQLVATQYNDAAVNNITFAQTGLSKGLYTVKTYQKEGISVSKLMIQ